MSDERKHKHTSIEPSINGPYLVKNLDELINSKGEQKETKPFIALCRCGGSANKPFCDGTHLRIGFTGEKEPNRVPDRMDDYEGEDIAIYDNRGVCSHRGNCTDNAPKVFQMGNEPWIHPDAQDAVETAKVIRTCPSGALSYTKDGTLSKEWFDEQKIIVTKDGPYDVQGHIKLGDPDGNTPEAKDHYTLCRCGHSKNKPFCNGQHWHIKFKDPRN